MNKQKTYFLFIDECLNPNLNLAALTGIFVPLDKYTLIRDEISKLVFNVQAPQINIVPPLIELHARNLLEELSNNNPNKTDKGKIKILSDIVDIVNRHRLLILRISYLNHREITDFLKGDSKLYQTIFSNILGLIQKFFFDSLILPVIDGIPSCKPSSRKSPKIDTQLIFSFAHQIRFIHHMRCNKNIKKGHSLDNFINIAEPVFVDSYYSTLIQLVDLVSYLLHQVEKTDLNPNKIKSDYQKKILNCARSIDSNNLITWKGKLIIS